jgi:hypothetical protein
MEAAGNTVSEIDPSAMLPNHGRHIVRSGKVEPEPAL